MMMLSRSFRLNRGVQLRGKGTINRSNHILQRIEQQQQQQQDMRSIWKPATTTTTTTTTAPNIPSSAAIGIGNSTPSTHPSTHNNNDPSTTTPKRPTIPPRDNAHQLQQHHHSLYSTTTRRPYSTIHTQPATRHHPHHRISPPHTQTRHMGGRKGGASAFSKPRPPTRKQLKRYHKRMREQHHRRVGRHSKPGSVAGKRREHRRREWQMLLDRAEGRVEEVDHSEYDFGDALIDDLMGNTSHLTSSPDPKPNHIGHQYNTYYTIVSKRMQAYHQHLSTNPSPPPSTPTNLPTTLPPPLPTDHQISSLLRSHRHRQAPSRSKPLSLPTALSHLLSPPLSLSPTLPTFGPLTYAALLSCVSSPAEARKVFSIMREHGHRPNAHHYSILVDVYARRGDIRGADEVLDEMRMEEGVGVTLAAYTSLMAGCFRVCNRGGSVGQGVKAEAGRLAWERWKEMRILGIEADVMAYGAIIRIMAARGLAERAISLLHEMPTFSILPTTLIYTSALRAVARSHANALRFSSGKVRSHKRRERIAMHHGKMAQSILIAAENSGCDLDGLSDGGGGDDGFWSALMLCAGTAGDFASVKAIVLGREVRRLGGVSERHLGMLRGESEPLAEIEGGGDGDGDGAVGFLERSDKETTEDTAANSILTNTETKIATINEQSDDLTTTPSPSWREREYGKDTRILSALLHSNARAMEPNGLGDMWTGFGGENRGYLCLNSLRLLVARQRPNYKNKNIPGMTGTEIGLSTMRFDDEDVMGMSKRDRRKKFRFEQDEEGNTVDDLEPEFARAIGVDGEELYDEDEGNFMEEGQVKLFSGVEGGKDHRDDPKIGADAGRDEFANVDKTIDTADFDQMFAQSEEGHSDGDGGGELEKASNLDEFARMMKEFGEGDVEGADDSTMDSRDEIVLADDGEEGAKGLEKEDDLEQFERMMKEFEAGGGGLADDDKEITKELDEFMTGFIRDNSDSSDTTRNTADNLEGTDEGSFSELKVSNEGEEPENISLMNLHSQMTPMETDDEQYPLKLEQQAKSSELEPSASKDELEILLQGFPAKRIQKVRDVLAQNLGKPSLIQLVPILRENMPDHITKGWLRQKNLQAADFVMEVAEKQGVVDRHILTSMLEVVAKSGSIDKAIIFHEEEFAKNNITPTAYCDRILLQMLLDNRRIGRALEFKNKIESKGKHLDLAAYGSLCNYYGNHNQVGSAILTLKECMSVHGSLPGEKNLTRLRIMCRKLGVDEEEDILKLIGRDPLQWLKEGESKLKREYSKKGRRDVTLPGNLLLRI